MKRIGILGGISPMSTILYYQQIIRGYYERRGDYHYPEVIIYSLNFQRFTDLENSGDREGYVQEIVTGITALQRAGADLIVMAANSPHAVFDEVQQQSAIPLLSIVEVTAEHARQQRMRDLLLLGIKFTMQASFYPEACRKWGIDITVPSLEEQNEVDRIIFEELAIGLVKPSSRARLLAILQRYDVDGVILGCTELPMILRQEHTAVPLLDTLSLHASAALEAALGDLGRSDAEGPK